MDGHGADELFGGYSIDMDKGIYDAGFNLFEVMNVIRTISDCGSYGFDNSSKIKLLRNHLKSWLGYSARRLLSVVGYNGDGNGYKSVSSKDAMHPMWKDLDYVNRSLYYSTHLRKP